MKRNHLKFCQGLRRFNISLTGNLDKQLISNLKILNLIKFVPFLMKKCKLYVDCLSVQMSTSNIVSWHDDAMQPKNESTVTSIIEACARFFVVCECYYHP